MRELRDVPVGAVPSEADRRDLVNLLERLAELSMHATGAERLSFFLLDEEQSMLHLWGAVTARTPPEGLWDLSLNLPGIELTDRGRALLDAGAPIVVAEAATSDLVPPAWVDTFGLRSLVVAPLLYDDRRLGILVIDYREPRAIEPAVVEMAGTVARTAAIAIATRGLADALSDEQERLRLLVAAGRTLSSPRSLVEVAEQVADAIVQVLGARHLSVHLLDEAGRRYQTILQRGVTLPVEGHLGAFPRWAVSRVADAWADSSGMPQPVILPTLEAEVRKEFAVPDEIGSVLVLPLFRTAGTIFGFVLVGSEGRRPPSPAIVDLAATLAGHVGFSVDRALLDEQVAVAAEFARVLLVADDLEDAGPDDLVGTLHRAVPPALGFDVVGVRLHQEGARRDGRSPTPFERRLWKNWRRRSTRPEPVEHDGFAYAAMWGGDRVGGLVKARVFVPPLAPHQRDLLDALAGAAGDVMQRRAMREAMAARERELMLERERADVAADLQAAVGHVLATIAGVAETFSNGLSRDEVLAGARRVAGLARAGLFGLEQAAAGEAFDAPGNGREGFETALGQIVERLGRRAGAAADLEVRGEVRALPSEVEQALIRVAHEALSRVGANGKASAVAVRLTFNASGVELSVRDDGADLAQRENGVVPAAHFGLRVMERRVGDLGGSLTVEHSEPRGLLVRAQIPA